MSHKNITIAFPQERSFLFLTFTSCILLDFLPLLNYRHFQALQALISIQIVSVIYDGDCSLHFFLLILTLIQTSSQKSDLKTFLFLNGTLSILLGTILILNTNTFSFLICSSDVTHFYAHNLVPFGSSLFVLDIYLLYICLTVLQGSIRAKNGY